MIQHYRRIQRNTVFVIAANFKEIKKRETEMQAGMLHFIKNRYQLGLNCHLAYQYLF